MTKITNAVKILDRIGPTTLLLATGLLIWCVFRPGLMSPDSVDQYQQAVSGRFHTWHPVCMAAVLRMVRYCGGDIGGLILGQCLLGILGMNALVGAVLNWRVPHWSARRVRWTATAVVLTMVSPLGPTIFYLVTFWKDTWTAIGLVWFLAIAIRLFVDDSQVSERAFLTRFAVLLAVIPVTCLPRHNAVCAMPAMCLAAFLILVRRHPRWSWVTLVAPPALFCGINALWGTVLHVDRLAPGNVPKALDLVGICVLYPDHRKDLPFTSQNLNEPVYRTHYRFGETGPFIWERPTVLTGYEMLTNTPNPKLDAEYWRAITRCPGALAVVRLRTFLRFLDPRQITFYTEITIADNSCGLSLDARTESLRQSLIDQTRCVERTPVLRWFTSVPLGWFLWNLVATVWLASGVRRSGWRSAAFGVSVLAVPLCYWLSYLLATTGLDYRFHYPSILAMQLLTWPVVVATAAEAVSRVHLPYRTFKEEHVAPSYRRAA